MEVKLWRKRLSFAAKNKMAVKDSRGRQRENCHHSFPSAFGVHPDIWESVRQIQQTVSVVKLPEQGEAEGCTCGLASRVDMPRERCTCRQKCIRRERLRSLELSIA